MKVLKRKCGDGGSDFQGEDGEGVVFVETEGFGVVSSGESEGAWIERDHSVGRAFCHGDVGVPGTKDVPCAERWRIAWRPEMAVREKEDMSVRRQRGVFREDGKLQARQGTGIVAVSLDGGHDARMAVEEFRDRLGGGFVQKVAEQDDAVGLEGDDVLFQPFHGERIAMNV